MKFAALLTIVALCSSLHAKTFQNSYISFEVPDDWACVQEGVAWTCTPQKPAQAKQAVIVLAAKTAGPEDNLTSFLNYLKQPKKIITKVGTPMPSQVIYAQQRVLAGENWIQAQHLSSEIPDFYTLYLATVRQRLAILASFSAEKNHYRDFNPVFDKAIKTLKIVASHNLLMPKTQAATPELGIQAGPLSAGDDPGALPARHRSKVAFVILFVLGLILLSAIYYLVALDRKSKNKIRSARPKR